MSVYIERKINEDLRFAAGLSHFWEVLHSRVNEHSLLIAELNVFGGLLALQHAEFFKQLSHTEVLKMLEIRKSISKVHMQIGCSVWMVRYRVHTDDFMTPLPVVLTSSELKSSYQCAISDGIVAFADLDPCLPSKEIAEEEGLLKFLRDRCDDLRRKNVRRRVLIREMEALGERGLAVDSLEYLKQTHARETAKLASLTDAIAESLAGIHEKERHVAKLDLND
nr:hypothetical protein [Tanacetum cinerariifolium]